MAIRAPRSWLIGTRCRCRTTNERNHRRCDVRLHLTPSPTNIRTCTHRPIKRMENECSLPQLTKHHHQVAIDGPNTRKWIFLSPTWDKILESPDRCSPHTYVKGNLHSPEQIGEYFQEGDHYEHITQRCHHLVHIAYQTMARKQRSQDNRKKWGHLTSVELELPFFKTKKVGCTSSGMHEKTENVVIIKSIGLYM